MYSTCHYMDMTMAKITESGEFIWGVTFFIWERASNFSRLWDYRHTLYTIEGTYLK